MAQASPSADVLDTELADLPPELRWREWMGRVEAVIFASPEPVTRDILSRIIGRDCVLDHLIEDIREELRGRPFDLVSVAGGFQHRTRPRFAPAILAATAGPDRQKALSASEMQCLAGIAYLQPITRAELARVFGRETSRDVVATLKRQGLIAAGPRSPEPGAPYTYVTTARFLTVFGLATLRDLPDMEALDDAGLLQRDVVDDAAVLLEPD